jgi:hypothetical protein
MHTIPLGSVQLSVKCWIRFGWILDGHVNIDLAKEALDAVVNRWRVLGARIQGEGKSSPWHLAIPLKFSPSSPAFHFTHSTSSEPLSKIYSFSPSSHFSSEIYTDPPLSLFSLSSDLCYSFPPPKSAPLLHLHIGHYPGLTVVGITTSHVVFDAISLGLVLREWEIALRDIDAYKAKGEDTSELGELGIRPWLSESIMLKPGWLPTGWSLPSWADIWSMTMKHVRIYIEDRFLKSFETRCMTIPKSFFESMKTDVHLELLHTYPNDPNFIISTADVVGAWIWQSTLSNKPESPTPTSFLNIVSARDTLNYTKTSCFNTWTCLSTSAFPIHEARTLSVAALSRRIRCVIQEQRTPEILSKVFTFRESRPKWAMPLQEGGQEILCVTNQVKGAAHTIDLKPAMEQGSGQVLHSSFTYENRTTNRNCFTVQESPDGLAFIITANARKTVWEHMRLSVESAKRNV